MSVQVYGCNHVAIEVGDIEKAVAFYKDVFNLEQMNGGEGDAFFKLGEHQFLAIFEVEKNITSTWSRHFAAIFAIRGATGFRLSIFTMNRLSGSCLMAKSRRRVSNSTRNNRCSSCWSDARFVRGDWMMRIHSRSRRTIAKSGSSCAISSRIRTRFGRAPILAASDKRPVHNEILH